MCSVSAKYYSTTRNDSSNDTFATFATFDATHFDTIWLIWTTESDDDGVIGRQERKSRRRKWRGIKFWESLKVKDVWWISWWLWGDVSVCVAIHFNQSITFIISKQNCAKSSSVTDMNLPLLTLIMSSPGQKSCPFLVSSFRQAAPLPIFHMVSLWIDSVRTLNWFIIVFFVLFF